MHSNNVGHKTFLVRLIYSIMANSTMPFQVKYSDTWSKTPRNMKRLALLLKPENADGIISALVSSGLEATIYDVRGAIKEKHRVESGKGSETVDLAYATRKVVATVVNDEDIEQVLEAMKKVLNGDRAVVMISSVDDLVRL